MYAQDTKLKTYNVKVVVHYEYEVEVENEAEAEEQGWAYTQRARTLRATRLQRLESGGG